MRALVTTQNGPPEVLRVQQRPEPEPGPGEVRIAVRAAGINFADTMARVGIYPDAPALPSVLGYEVAGELESLGEGVDGLAVGDRVIAATRFGGYAELAVTAASNVFTLPDAWSFEEGAALPVNYATAYAGLVRYGNVRDGERVLVHAAAGGVGIAATQIAKLRGAEVFGTASTAKHDAIRAQGVDHPIDYRTQDFRREIRRLTGQQRPLDLALDAVGGASFRKSFSLLRAGGRLVPFGASSAMRGDRRHLPSNVKMIATTPIFHPLRLASSSRAVIGLNLLTLWDDRGTLADYIPPLREWADAGLIRPVVDSTFLLERGADAHRHMGEGRNVGKVVLTL